MTRLGLPGQVREDHHQGQECPPTNHNHQKSTRWDFPKRPGPPRSVAGTSYSRRGFSRATGQKTGFAAQVIGEGTKTKEQNRKERDMERVNLVGLGIFWVGKGREYFLWIWLSGIERDLRESPHGFFISSS